MLPVEREVLLKRWLARATISQGKRSEVTAIHASNWKTGSQWLRLCLTDPRSLRAMRMIPLYQPEPDRFPPEQPGTITSPCYCVGPQDLKPSTRVFYLARDPSSLLASWHISNRYTHPPNSAVDRRRRLMEGLSESAAVGVSAEEFMPLLEIQDHWLDKAASANILLADFEHLKADPAGLLSSVLAHFGVATDEARPLSVRLASLYTHERLTRASGAKYDRNTPLDKQDQIRAATDELLAQPKFRASLDKYKRWRAGSF